MEPTPTQFKVGDTVRIVGPSERRGNEFVISEIVNIRAEENQPYWKMFPGMPSDEYATGDGEASGVWLSWLDLVKKGGQS